MLTVGPVSPELVDLITEAVATPATAAERATVVTEIIDRIVDAIGWRHGSHPDVRERDSLVLLVEAAFAHQDRMAQLS